jgi:2-hydroxy-3-oxopropionate reductase
MSTIAFIGLGVMGTPMAANLVSVGYDVIGFSRQRISVDRLVERGGRGAANVAEAVGEAEAVVTMVPDGTDVTGLALGDNGFYAAMKPGALHIDCSTIPPRTSHDLAAAGAGLGLRVVDAPVSGGEQGAIEASLSIMVGGAAGDVEAGCRPCPRSRWPRPHRAATARRRALRPPALT